MENEQEQQNEDPDCQTDTEHRSPIEYDVINLSIPPYYVVSYCKMIGFDLPEDRAWREIARGSVFFAQELLACSCSELSKIGSRWSQLPAFQPIKIYMHRCFFRFEGKISFYRIGQCPACHTIYWSEDDQNGEMLNDEAA